MSGQKAGNVETEQLTIQDWVKGLAAIPGCDFTLETVQDYVLQHAVRPETLDRYCYFSKEATPAILFSKMKCLSA